MTHTQGLGLLHMTHTQGLGLLGTMALQQSLAHDNLQVLREGLKGPLL